MRCAISILVLLFTTDLSAQESTTVLFGQPWLNGRGWQAVDSRAKLMYITAFNEGSGIAIINWLTTGNPKPTDAEFSKQESFYTSDGAFSANDTSEQSDKFYGIRGNLDIPVAYAMLFVVLKFRGGTPRDLEAYNVRLRKMVTEKTAHVPPPIKVR